MPSQENAPVNITKDTVAAAPRVRPPPRARRRSVGVTAADLDLAPGARVDRYVIRAVLGSGGMGVVFRADDPDLGRPVALKLLRPGTELEGTEGRARLVREGQAIAQLSHPNVVAVHDIGVYRDELCFVAMELVEGRALRQWLEAARRTLPQILDVFVQAGRGLAAAHAKGIVHRDFKPDNVLVGDDGRVRVADFGLARAEHEAAPEPTGDATDDDDEHDRAADDSVTPGLATPLTEPGRVMGTPAYMAPEQRRGERGDARSDQYSFCVALYQALCGERPFERRPPASRPVPPRPMPPSAKVPRWLEQVVVRGLAFAPADRFPTMNALLAELTRDRGRGRRTAVLAAGAAGAAGLGVAIAVAAVAPAPARPCAAAGAPARAAWDGATRARVRAAFLAVDTPAAAPSLARFEQRIDAYRADWATTATASCEATRVHAVQSEAVLDRRSACLDRRLGELRALLDVVSSELDPARIASAIDAAWALTPPASCDAAMALAPAAAPPADPEARARADALRADLDHAAALAATGRLPDALDRVRAVAPAADALGYAPLQAEVQLRLGTVQHKLGALADGEASLQLAIERASAARDPVIVADALSELVWVVGFRGARYAEGLAYSRAAVAATELASGDVARRARLAKHTAAVWFEQGEYDRARRLYEEAAAALEQAYGPEHPFQAVARSNIGNALLAQGKAAEAQPHLERALAIAEATLGPDHPEVADYLNNLGAALGDQGRATEGRVHYLRALATLERALGPDHLDVAYALFNLGVGHVNAEEHDQAAPYFERALAIREAALGPDHPHVAYPLTGIGHCRMAQGRIDEALAAFERALRIAEGAQADPTLIATARYDLAQALWQAGRDRDRAIELATLAHRTWKDEPRWQREAEDAAAWLASRRGR